METVTQADCGKDSPSSQAQCVKYAASTSYLREVRQDQIKGKMYFVKYTGKLTVVTQFIKYSLST